MKGAVLAAALTLALAAGAELLLGFVHCVCPVVPQEEALAIALGGVGGVG